MTKHTDCLITYQKANGDIIMRPRLGFCGLENIQIGNETSMGWKIIDIHYQFYDGNYYHEKDYRKKQKEYVEKKESFKKRLANYIIFKATNWLHEE